VDMAAVGEDLPGAPEHPSHGSREAGHHGLEPAGQVPGLRPAPARLPPQRGDPARSNAS
jgi:hypothetical protein